MWGATRNAGVLLFQGGISIHAPRVGRDPRPSRFRRFLPDFNPRAPCGARRKQTLFANKMLTFQSTRPVWGATKSGVDDIKRKQISIHAPRVGRDSLSFTFLSFGRYFNPRAPCGARPICKFGITYILPFQSTRPVWGATARVLQAPVRRPISIHAPRVGRDAALCDISRAAAISIHAPRVGRDNGKRLVCNVCHISIHAPRVGRDRKFDDFTPSNLHKRYKRVLARPKNTREKGKIKQKLAYIHAFSAFLGCEGSGTFCALVLRTQYR